MNSALRKVDLLAKVGAPAAMGALLATTSQVEGLGLGLGLRLGLRLGLGLGVRGQV